MVSVRSREWVLGTGYWGLGTGDVAVRYDGHTFFVFSKILSPSNTPYGLTTLKQCISINIVGWASSPPRTGKMPVPQEKHNATF